MNDYIVSILEDYYNFEIEKHNKGYSERLRIENDDDVKYYLDKGYSKIDALFADNIISFWTIYKRILELEANWHVYKSEKSLLALIRQINSKRENDFTNKIISVNKALEPFAKAVRSSGNYMLLPDRGMNNLRYKIAEDRIDVTLFQSFSGGKLASFFKNDTDICEWINRENLKFMFDDKIDQDHLRWFVNNEKKISEMGKNEIYAYIDGAMDLINKRNNIKPFA